MTRDAQAESQGDAPQPTRVRPFIITVFCCTIWLVALVVIVLVFLDFVLGVLDSGSPLREAMFSTILLVFWSLAGIGLWRMEKWGVVLFTLCWCADSVHDLILGKRELLLGFIPTGLVAAVVLGGMLWGVVSGHDSE